MKDFKIGAEMHKSEVDTFLNTSPYITALSSALHIPRCPGAPEEWPRLRTMF